MEKERNNWWHWNMTGKLEETSSDFSANPCRILMVCLGGPPKFQCRTCTGIFGVPWEGPLKAKKWHQLTRNRWRNGKLSVTNLRTVFCRTAAYTLEIYWNIHFPYTAYRILEYALRMGLNWCEVGFLAKIFSVYLAIKWADGVPLKLANDCIPSPTSCSAITQ